MILFACDQYLEDQTKFAVIISSFIRHICRRHTGGNSPENKNNFDNTAQEKNKEYFASL